ncbi:sugar transferase [Thalassococcus sp. CAU 1522]|uniref:Sugar transferase n=1 Tax=Thalassococcus arenae TaxID=2851652 RepID=A0ABS6N6H9_9RHOB|nr:sugar transferase [Thalassococcus arenae]MBV2359615.1 sugar transferase [Thalassococcus arenae]
MTLHIRQPLPSAELDKLIDDALSYAPTSGLYREFLKRALDIVLVLLAALPVLIVVCVVAILVARDGRSPFYIQKRVGRGGRSFDMFKLRSMVQDADRLLEAHLAADPEARAEWNRTQKLRRDPRITAIGRFIRKSSIDELPQLWNVLRGDMSLVGPRPMMLDQQDIYPGTAYYALRPGVTGFWQVSVRNESSFAERANFDTAYLRELSFKTDLKVLFKTVQVVLRGTGC